MKNKLIALLLLLSLSVSSFAAWDPLKKGRDAETGVSEKTMLALQAFKEIPELEPFFEQANGFALFHNVAKGGLGIGGASRKGEVFQGGKVIGSTSLKQLSIGF